jgi:hypothetical protein
LRRYAISAFNADTFWREIDEVGLGGAVRRDQILREIEQLGGKITYAGMPRRHVLKIDLGSLDVSDEHLARLKNLRELQELYLGYTRVADQSLGHLSCLGQLRLLDLEHTGVSDSGLVHLPARAEDGCL